ncbi:MAG: tRNA pseudouridine(38-40) synthase TruA [Phycisphaerae bacterium]|jgi:tRNA pseudouridine38-40 synthase|nr:tRNA pseudouridine(38-40) synthase TruA [Phycisphaerae bacterium]MDP7636811.1 tRNA pseudouridine(38-40) synthase TruA [Phycisphaerae bacterium]
MSWNSPRRNIKLVIAYNGAAYHGWQRQAASIDTVQQRIEDAAARVVKHPVTVFATGRTDAGVHAAGQAANFYTTNLRIPTEALRRAINSRLPGDIAVSSACEVPQDFHASRSAVGKTYRYRIHTGPTRPVELARQVYHYPRPLDVERMAAAARWLIGTHDFRGFATTAEQRQDTVRTIFRCEVACVDTEIHITVWGDGFLYNMVRNIVGTLVEIGRGRWEPSHIDTILAARDRRLAGPTALPDGLSLICVHYDSRSLDMSAPTGRQAPSGVL